jgi:hypothetical protein
MPAIRRLLIGAIKLAAYRKSIGNLKDVKGNK